MYISDYPVIVEGGEGYIRSLDVPHVDGGVHHHGGAAAASFLVYPLIRQTNALTNKKQAKKGTRKK